MQENLIDIHELAKAYSGVPALRSATVSVACGEVVAVMGENGAGKSTLMKIIAGSLGHDAGSIVFAGGKRPRIGMVHQEAMLAPHLTVAENLFLGHEPRQAGIFIDNRTTLAAARSYLAQHRLDLDAAVCVGALNAAQKQMLELARALRLNPDLLILDEPTSSLAEHGSREVLRIVEECRAHGKAILYISHRFEEVRKSATRVMVLRDGATVFSGDLRDLTDADLVKHMAGHAPQSARPSEARQRAQRGEVLLRWTPADAPSGAKHAASGATHAAPGAPHVASAAHNDASPALTLHAGEIVGLAGLMGAGRTELCESLFGTRARAAGSFELLGRAVQSHSPRESLAAGLVYLSEDRQHFGILKGRDLSENIAISALFSGPLGWLDITRERSTVAGMIQRLSIRGRATQAIETLSGGNQQKGLLARWMLTRARVFLLDEPTRGIDVNAKEEVFALMEELAAQGAAILMVSSEIPELIRMCDRLLVMRENKIVHELDPAATTREEVLHWAI